MRALSARRSWLSLGVLLWPALVAAQPAPTVVSTLRTTSTAATSVRVGCTQAGTCTGGVVAGPVDVASVTSAGFIGIASNVPASTVMRLYNNAGTLMWNGAVVAVGSSVSGTIGKLSKFTAANALGDSICSESGTTITCVNTIAATTGTFTNIGGTLTTASQTAITGVGTITTGTWSATIIGLAKGGTGADLSGTGGTSQFLRQNTVGGTVTVVRPAISDLSDGTNVALLNALNAFTGAGNQTITASANGGVGWLVTNSNTGTAASAAIELDNSTPTSGIFMHASTGFTSIPAYGNSFTAVRGTGSGGLIIAAEHASGSVKFFAGGLSNARWGVNSAGDFTFGASSHIADSSGTPVRNSGCGGGSIITGVDYAFTATKQGGTDTSCSLNFGHTFSSAPVCVALGDATVPVTGLSTSTTNVTLFYASTASTVLFNIMCRGY